MAKRKAISLMSGGLDSTLASKLILDQGIDVVGLFLESPFGCKENVQGVAAHLGIPLKIIHKGMDYVALVRKPKYGYGKHINPCIDCRVYMFRIAHQVMEEEGADFIITGEVLGQRPMSQRREAMEVIDRDSETAGLILRPLSAGHYPPTRPELEGWVDREKLLNITGRSRTEQFKWAKSLNLKEYSAPAGGCLLTDANFSRRLSSFFEQKKDPSMTEVRLLRYGRHFDLADGRHLIVGRNKAENEALQKESESDVASGKMTFFRPLFSGPSAVLSGGGKPDSFDEVGPLIARYAKKGLLAEQLVEVTQGAQTFQIKIRFPQSPMDVSKEGLPVLQ